jgi:NADH-quinone oxidoreductase subunit M
MGFVTLGFFIFNDLGVAGAHGADDLARLRLGRDVPVHRRAVRPRALPQIADYGGVVNTMPKFAAFSCCSRWPTAACRARAGFVGEFMVILARSKANFWIGFSAATTLIFGAAYTLWMSSACTSGPWPTTTSRPPQDINGREFLMLALLAIAVLWMGCIPSPSPT